MFLCQFLAAPFFAILEGLVSAFIYILFETQRQAKEVWSGLPLVEPGFTAIMQYYSVSFYPLNANIVTMNVLPNVLLRSYFRW